MSKYFIYYAINSNNQLIISCYHTEIPAKIAFRRFNKDKQSNPFKITGELPEKVEQVNALIKRELSDIKQHVQEDANEKPQISEIVYTGDVNLGFGGRDTFPPCLFDDSLHELFKSLNVRLCLYLESSNLDIVEKAAKLHFKKYAQAHAENYPNSPVNIQLKTDSKPFYVSPYSQQMIEKLKKSSPFNSQYSSPYNSPKLSISSLKNLLFSPSNSPNADRSSKEPKLGNSPTFHL